MFHTYVASVLSRCCVCFTMVFNEFSGVFASVLDACFKCSICLQTYIASVASRHFKSRSGVASFCSLSAASPRCLLLLPAGWVSVTPSFSSRCWWRSKRHGLHVGAWNDAGNRLQVRTSGRLILTLASSQRCSYYLMQELFFSLFINWFGSIPPPSTARPGEILLLAVFT